MIGTASIVPAGDPRTRLYRRLTTRFPPVDSICMMPRPAGASPVIDVQREREGARGWSYDVTLTRSEVASDHAVTLSWSDHDHWSGGAIPPSRVVERILAWLADEHPEVVWPQQFDVSTVRRRFPDLDETLGQRL